MNDHEKRITKIEQDRTPIDDDHDIAKRLLAGRNAAVPPPTQTRDELEKIAADKRHSLLARRLAQANLQVNHFIGGPEQVAERLARYKAGVDLA